MGGLSAGPTLARLCGIVLLLLIFVVGESRAQSPSLSNRRPPRTDEKVLRPPAGPTKQGSAPTKEKCNLPPSRVEVGSDGKSVDTKPAHKNMPFQPISQAAHWRCDRPSIRVKEVWAGEPVVCEFEFLNDGARPLSIQARGG